MEVRSDMVSGFQCGAVASGLKKSGDLDLGLIYSETPAAVAGVFTTNRVQAAPVVLSRERIQSGHCRAVVVNSGNANCCNGDQGMADANAMTRMAAEALDIPESSVLAAATGVIGQPMAMEGVVSAIPALVNALSGEGWTDLARAIMTTDRVPKIISRSLPVGATQCTITAVAKGAGMIRPDMATMLCFVCTDAAAAPETLRQMLKTATDQSFNRITIDGDTSTNDTVFLLAGGGCGARIDQEPDAAGFQAVLNEMLAELARMIVKDGEGATKLVEIVVKGAASHADARKVADTVAHSSLVKTALFGEDANWGRIVAAVGRAGIPVQTKHIDVYFDKVQMVAGGLGAGADAEAGATEVIRQSEFTITIDLNAGSQAAAVWTCDFSIDYVKINADYRS